MFSKYHYTASWSAHLSSGTHCRPGSQGRLGRSRHARPTSQTEARDVGAAPENTLLLLADINIGTDKNNNYYKVNVLEMKCLRSLVGVSRMERVRNEEVFQKNWNRKGVSE